MNRRNVVALLLIVFLSGTALKTVAATPDCQKWLMEYREKLAASRAAAELRRARAKLHRVATPRPPVSTAAAHPVHHVRRPHRTPEDMLQRFQVLCADNVDDAPVFPLEGTPLFAMNSTPVLTLSPTDVVLQPDTPTAPPDEPITTTGSGTETPPSLPGFPGFPPVLTGGSPPQSTTPPVTTPPVTTPTGGPPPPVTTPPGGVTPVPEPGSLLLLATGLAGVGAAGLRRRTA